MTTPIKMNWLIGLSMGLAVDYAYAWPTFDCTVSNLNAGSTTTCYNNGSSVCPNTNIASYPPSPIPSGGVSESWPCESMAKISTATFNVACIPSTPLPSSVQLVVTNVTWGIVPANDVSMVAMGPNCSASTTCPVTWLMPSCEGCASTKTASCSNTTATTTSTCGFQVYNAAEQMEYSEIVEVTCSVIATPTSNAVKQTH